jgi:TonB family protein
VKSRTKLSSFALLGMLCVAPVFAQEQRTEPQAPRLIRKSGGVLQASAVRRVEPVYPPLAKAAQVSGSVVVEVTVDETGAVSEARALSGHPLLKDPAVAAARGWAFTPTKLEGNPVKVIGTITFNFELGDPKRIEELEAQIRRDPDSAHTHVMLANEYRGAGRNTEAIAEYKEAIRIEPNYAAAHFELGRVYDRVGGINESREELKQAFTLSIDKSDGPRNNLPFDAHLFIAQFYYGHGEYREAIEVLKKVASLYPELDDVHVALGATYLALGDKLSALNEYDILKDKTTEGAQNLLKQIEKK